MKKEIKKKSKILKIILLIIAIIIIVIISAGIYLYYFHTFKTLRFCVTEDSQDTKMPCKNNKECLDFLLQTIGPIQKSIDSSPVFMRELFYEVLNNSIICIDTCRIRNIKGPGFNNMTVDELCSPNDIEISRKIHGKEGIEMLMYLKDNNNTIM
jgi:hypothetical protein